MTAAQLAQIEKILKDLIAELSGKGPSKIEPNRSVAGEVGGDQDEQPLNEMLQAIASQRNRTQGNMLARAQKALTRLLKEPEDFGACEICEEQIAFGRLKAMPYAELCVACQSKQDGPKSGHTRKKITDYR